jgi:hypothetical protein
MNEQKQMKLCRMCNEVKELEGGFYKAGTSYQRNCIPCHNIKRYDYPHKSNYKKKPKGFEKLDEDTRKKILYDISVKLNFKEIAKKYDIKYNTILSWKRKGLIV